MERYVEVDGRRIRAGTLADAAAMCRTNDGRPLSVHDLRSRITRGGPSDPPPYITVVDDDDPDGPRVPLRNAKGQRLVDLDAYAEWDRTRPRKGGMRPSQFTPDTLPRRPGWEAILVAARDGKLAIAPGYRAGHRGATLIDGVAQSKWVSQWVAVFERMGLLGAPSGEDGVSGPVPLTDVGGGVLTRWGVPPPE